MPTPTPDELIAMELNTYYANPLGLVMVAYPCIAAVMRHQRPAYKVAVMFIDSAYGAPNVERLHMLGFANLVEVNFGAASPDRHQAKARDRRCHRRGPDAAAETLRWLAIHPQPIAASPQQRVEPLACSQYAHLVNEVSVCVR